MLRKSNSFYGILYKGFNPNSTVIYLYIQPQPSRETNKKQQITLGLAMHIKTCPRNYIQYIFRENV